MLLDIHVDNYFKGTSLDKWVGTEKDRVAKGTKCFIAIGVFSVEL